MESVEVRDPKQDNSSCGNPLIVSDHLEAMRTVSTIAATIGTPLLRPIGSFHRQMQETERRSEKAFLIEGPRGTAATGLEDARIHDIDRLLPCVA